MAFYWKGNSLFTRKSTLPDAQTRKETTFVLDYRNTTSPVPSLLQLSQFLASSLTFVGLSSIDLFLDEWKLLSLNKLAAPAYDVPIPKPLDTKTLEGLMKVESVVHETAQLNATWMNIIGWNAKSAAVQSNNQIQVTKGPTSQSLRSFFSKFSSHNTNSAVERAAKEEKAVQEAISEKLAHQCSATVFLHVNTAVIVTNIPKNFAMELERATKKPPPKRTKIAVLTGSDGRVAELEKSAESRATDIFASVLPSSKGGRVYIGFPTHQTTGLSAHISAQSVIPTVERESIDLNARWVRTWNTELLRAAGIVSRIAWNVEISRIREALTRALAEAKTTKIQPEDIDKVLPDAVRVLNEFTFRESTPASQVGALVEEAFWTCNKTTSIEILSSRGILPSQSVRIATDELSFVGGIPVVPQALFKEANGFVKRLIDFGIITEVTTTDIQKELEAQALNTKQMIEFLSWLTHKAKISEIDRPAIAAMLDATVVNDEETGKVLVLSQIKSYVNPSKIPSNMPIPTDTIPFKFTKELESTALDDIGWQVLQIVPWMRYLVENAGSMGALTQEQDLFHSAAFASQVLSVLSKQWDGLTASSKTTVTNLLETKAVMPTKLGMRKPSDSYFPSVRLFEDLPIVTLNNVKEKFLVALGVRKTIELNLIFDRLLKPNSAAAPSPQAAWSHVDLIKYLASVQKDIPSADIKKLKATPICLAENDESKTRHRLSQLYEPTDELRSLRLKLLQWPSTYRSGSEEARFMKTLGLNAFPSIEVLIQMIAKATADLNPESRDRGLKYLVDHKTQLGYSTPEIASTTTPFLPIQGNEKLSALPSRCFTNEKAAMMGFHVLRRDLHPHATMLGVEINPPIAECVDWLLKAPPSTHRNARELFEYFASRVHELSDARIISNLSVANIVPVAKDPKTTTSPSGVRRLPPNLCFLGSGGLYADIFDYVDFGTAANTFLLHCGAKAEPTSVELARAVIREPARVFNTFDSAEKYLALLLRLANAWPTLKKDKALVKEMKVSPFLLAFTEYTDSSKQKKAKERKSLVEDEDDSDGEEPVVRTYQLAPAQRIVLADDIINYNLFKGSILTCPMDDDLEVFYSQLGSPALSSLIEERPRVGNPLPDQRSADRVKRLVAERIKILFHAGEISRDQIKHDASWAEKNIRFIAVSNLSVQKSLKGHSSSHTIRLAAHPHTAPHYGQMIYFTPEVRDLFNMSQALLHILLYRSKPNQAVILTSLLEHDLYRLRSMGYNVSRILNRKEAQARIAEEQRKKQLEEEQERIKVENAQRALDIRGSPENQRSIKMPGGFPDLAENGIDSPPKPPASEQGSRRPSGLFSAFTRSLRPRSPDLPLPLETKNTTPIRNPETTSEAPITTPQQLQQNLLNAVNASRAHNSHAVMSNPAVNDVRETNTFCDNKPGQNITFFAESSAGLKIFLPRNMEDKSRYIGANSSAFNAFGTVMLTIAEAMHLPRQSIHLFYDVSESIAFNQGRALFFNYRYFENLHLATVQRGDISNAVVYWFVTACHEVAHNLIADHSSAHSYYTYVPLPYTCLFFILTIN